MGIPQHIHNDTGDGTMRKNEAKRRFTDYLTSEHIQYRLLNETGKLAPLENIDAILKM